MPCAPVSNQTLIAVRVARRDGADFRQSFGWSELEALPDGDGEKSSKRERDEIGGHGKKEIGGMIVAIVLSDHPTRTEFLNRRAACGVGARRKAGAFARAGQQDVVQGSDGGSLPTQAGQGEMWRRDVRPPSDQ